VDLGIHGALGVLGALGAVGGVGAAGALGALGVCVRKELSRINQNLLLKVFLELHMNITTKQN
jgi:hypothetical protein